MNITLDFGRNGLVVDVPDRNLRHVLELHGAQPLADPRGRLGELLKQPLGSPPLAGLAASRKSACVVICDITRPVPNALLLAGIFEELEAGGIGPEETVILIATGLHRPSTKEEIQAMVGPAIARRYRIINHRARVDEEQRLLGETRRGTPVLIDEVYCSADLKITTGFIEPHLMAGFSGGRKMVAPGCASERTIKALHSPAFIEHPLCREGSLEGNPLHEELLEIAGMAGHDFIVNVALDAERRMTGVFAGDPVRAHAEGVEHVRRSVRDTFAEPADIVVTTSAGYPLDLTLYQAVKGMTAAVPAVRRGGTMILAAECAEGLGGDEFVRIATRYARADDVLPDLLHRPVEIDQWQVEECAKVARWCDVVLVSRGIPEDVAGRLFIRTAGSVEDAIADALRVHGPDARIAVIPRGPYTLVEQA